MAITEFLNFEFVVMTLVATLVLREILSGSEALDEITTIKTDLR